MFRLLGHVLPEKKAIGMALTNIYGIWVSRATEICKDLGLDFNKKVKDLTDEEKKLISDKVRNDYVLENDLRRQVNWDIKRLKELKTIRGMKHNLWMPVRGQQTRTNAKTAKKLLGRARVRPTTKK